MVIWRIESVNWKCSLEGRLDGDRENGKSSWKDEVYIDFYRYIYIGHLKMLREFALFFRGNLLKVKGETHSLPLFSKENLLMWIRRLL